MKFLLPFMIIILIAGCGGIKPEYFNSTISSELQTYNSRLINDFVEIITQKFLPAKTMLYIKTDDKDKEFYNTLTTKLREKGYAISDNSQIKNLTFISYNISKLDSENIIVTYNINESKINRIYKINNNTLIPSGKITNFNFNE